MEFINKYIAGTENVKLAIGMYKGAIENQLSVTQQFARIITDKGKMK
jgi:hypothetical protein